MLRFLTVIVAIGLFLPQPLVAQDFELGLRVIRYTQRTLCLENVGGGYASGITNAIVHRDVRKSQALTYAYALAEPIENEMLIGRSNRAKVFLDRMIEVTDPSSPVEMERLARVCALGRLTLLSIRDGEATALDSKQRFLSELRAAPNTEFLGATAGQLVTLAAQAGEFGLAKEIAETYTSPRLARSGALSALFYQNASEGLRLSGQTVLTNDLLQRRTSRNASDYLQPLWEAENIYQSLRDLPRGSRERQRLLNSNLFTEPNLKTIFMRDPEMAAKIALYRLGEPGISPQLAQLLVGTARASTIYAIQRMPDRSFAIYSSLANMPSSVPESIRSSLLQEYRKAIYEMRSGEDLGATLLAAPHTIQTSMQGLTAPRARFLEIRDYETAHLLAEIERFDPLTAFLATRSLGSGNRRASRNMIEVHDALIRNPRREEIYWGNLLRASPQQFARYETGPEFHRAVGSNAYRRKTPVSEARSLARRARSVIGSRTPIASMEQVRDVLLPNEAAISVIAGDTHGGVLVFTDSRVMHFRIDATRAELESLASRVLRSLRDENAALDEAALGRISQLTLNTALGQIGEKNQIYWIADGTLGTLPPHLLLSRDGVQKRYLIEDYAVSVLPSLSALYWSRNLQRETLANSYLGIGNPQLSGAYDGSLGTNIALPTLAQSSEIVGRFGSLPGSGQHLLELANEFAQSETLLQGKATESGLGKRKGHYSVLAFATHGIDAGATGYIAEAGLILTPEPDYEGFLRASEVAESGISGNVVLLTACSSLRGDGMRVGGPIGGLARAFFANGSKAVVGSNWDVPDKPSYAFSASLVMALTSGKTVGQAHREAMLAAMAQSSDPHDWGSFTLSGDGQATID